MLNFRDELGGIERANQQGFTDKRAQYDSALARRDHAARTIHARLYDVVALLSKYPNLGLPLVSYDESSEHKMFASPNITPLGMSWLLGMVTVTDRGEVYRFRRECVVAPEVKVARKLKKYAMSIGIPAGGKIAWLPPLDHPISYASADLAVVIPQDWTKSTYGSSYPHPDTWHTTSTFPGQKDNNAFGLFPDGTPAIITYSSSRDGTSWTATELEPYLKWNVKLLFENDTNTSHRGF